MNICIWGFDNELDIIKSLKENKSYNLFHFGQKPFADYDYNDLNLESNITKFPNEKFTKENEKLVDEIAEEKFKDFSKIISRLSVYFRDEMTLNDYENICRIFIRYAYYFIIINEIDVFICKNVPHEQLDYAFYIVAQKLKLKIIIGSVEIPGYYIYFNNIEDHGQFCDCLVDAEYESLDLPEVATPAYMAPELLFDDRMELSYRSFKKNIFKHQSPRSFIMDLARVIRHKNLKRDYIKRLNKITNRNVDLTRKFIYFGLHLQPEATVFPYGGKYSDQILAIEKISQFIPDDVVIYVKENPKQTYIMREKIWFDRLKRINNVQVIPSETNTYDLIKNCVFSSTITGTIGWESIRMNKPVLIFGHAWYKQFDGVFQYSDNILYSLIENYCIDSDKLKIKYNEIVSKCIKLPVSTSDIDLYSGYIESSLQKINYLLKL